MKYIVGITGGTGYVGSSIAKRISQSFDIKLIDIKPPRECTGDNIHFRECDVRNFEEVKKALDDVDLVIHTSIVQIPAINENKKLGYEVNVIGTQNVCKAVEENNRTKGLILSGSWHTIGEKELRGIINEEFGFRPDKVEGRARLYALAKMAQESIVRFYDEMTPKVFGIVRMGTVLGQDMPEKTAANIFIQNGIEGKPLTPFRNSMYRPMLYVDIDDICQAYKKFATKILTNEVKKQGNSVDQIFNVYYPEPITILELAKISQEEIENESNGKLKPEIKIVETGQAGMFNEKDKELIKVDSAKALRFLEIQSLKSPRESIKEIVKLRLNKISK